MHQTADHLRSVGPGSPAPILLASFLATAGTSLFAFALPLLSLDERMSGSWLGSAFALYFLARLLAAPLGGLWADKSGPRTPFLAACALGLAAPGAWVLAPGMPALLAVQMLLGIASGVARPATLSGITTLTPPDRHPLWLSRSAATANAALLLGPALGGLLYLDRTLPPVLLGLAGCMLLAALAGLRLPAFPPETAAPSATPPGAPTTSTLPPLLLAIAGRTLGIGAFTAFYPLILAQALVLPSAGRDIPLAGSLYVALLFIVSTLTGLLLLPVAGRWMRGRSLGLASVLGMTLSGLALFALGLARSPLAFLGFGALMGLGTAISLPASMTLTAGPAASSAPELTDVPASRQGTRFGTAQAAAGLGFLLGPMLGGLAVRLSGQSGPALTLTGLIGLILTLPLLLASLRRLPGWSRAYSGLTVLLAALALAGLVLVSGIVSNLIPARPDDQLHQYTDTAMGTVVRLTFDLSSPQADGSAPPSRAEADRAAREVIDLIRAWQRDLDHRSPSGSVGRVNAQAGQRAVTVTPRALALIRRSLDFARLTDGAFDPTVGALTTLPFYFALDPSVAASKARLVDWRKVAVSSDSVRLAEPGMALDLGGIAKGSIIDAAATALRDMGFISGMVEAGGDFRVFGPRSWAIGVQDPRGADDQTLETLHITSRAVCTSGDYRRFVIPGPPGAPRQHHIMDPGSMASAAGAVSVTVLADTAEEADALATALFVMGPEQGLAFLQTYNGADTGKVQAQWVTPDLGLVSSPGFPQP